MWEIEIVPRAGQTLLILSKGGLTRGSVIVETDQEILNWQLTIGHLNKIERLIEPQEIRTNL